MFYPNLKCYLKYLVFDNFKLTINDTMTISLSMYYTNLINVNIKLQLSVFI